MQQRQIFFHKSAQKYNKEKKNLLKSAQKCNKDTKFFIKLPTNTTKKKKIFLKVPRNATKIFYDLPKNALKYKIYIYIYIYSKKSQYIPYKLHKSAQKYNKDKKNLLKSAQK